MDLLIDYFEHYLNYAIMIAVSLITASISARIRSVYNIYASHGIQSGVSGNQAAKIILSKNKLLQISISPTQDKQKDTYLHRTKQIKLTQKNYSDSSISSVASGAHEAGYAIQAQESYTIMAFLASLRPIVRTFSTLFVFVIVIGVLANTLVNINVLIYLLLFVFVLQIITLPAEFTASSIALQELKQTGILNEEELYGAKKMLRSVALSCIIAAITTLIIIALNLK